MKEKRIVGAIYVYLQSSWGSPEGVVILYCPQGSGLRDRLHDSYIRREGGSRRKTRIVKLKIEGERNS